MTTGQRVLLAILSIVIAIAAMWLWVRALDVSTADVTALLDRLRWWTVPFILALLAFHIWLAAIRWARIEIALGGARPSTGRAFATGALALGVGTFLPGPIANVACRSLSNRLSGSSGVRGALGGGLDQIADIAVIMLFVVPSAIGFMARSASIYCLAAVIAAIFGWLLIVSPRKAMLRRMAAPLEKRVSGVTGFLDSGILPRVYLLTLARVANLTAITFLVHDACGAASAGGVIVAVPLVTLAISVAMLPGAIGVSEWSFTGVLAGFGDSTSEIATFVLANRLLLTPLGLLLALAAAVAIAVVRRPGNVARTATPS